MKSGKIDLSAKRKFKIYKLYWKYFMLLRHVEMSNMQISIYIFAISLESNRNTWINKRLRFDWREYKIQFTSWWIALSASMSAKHLSSMLLLSRCSSAPIEVKLSSATLDISFKLLIKSHSTFVFVYNFFRQLELRFYVTHVVSIMTLHTLLNWRFIFSLYLVFYLDRKGLK